jgi:hypothetical protein
MNHIRTATVQDAVQVANNLRPEDRQEIEGLGHTPLALVFSVLVSDVAVSFFNTEGEIAGVAGIVKESDIKGQIWMICTSAVELNPHTFVRHAKRWLNKEQRNYRLLWNLADARNHYHHKLLRMLGFRAIRTVPCGPQHLPYLEIVKLCASPQEPLV